MGFFSTLLRIVAYIPTIIAGVESLFGSRNGATKQQAASSFVLTALNFGEAIAQKDIVDQDEFKAGLDDTIKGVVRMLNASVWHKSKVQ